MVIDLDHLAGEMDAIEQRGIRVGPENLSSRIRPPFPCRGTRYRTGWKKTALPERAPQDMPVLHPLPRIDEIKKDVDDDPRAAYLDQVHNGVYIRMAIILALLGIPDPLTGKKVLQR